MTTPSATLPASLAAACADLPTRDGAWCPVVDGVVCAPMDIGITTWEGRVTVEAFSPGVEMSSDVRRSDDARWLPFEAVAAEAVKASALRAFVDGSDAPPTDDDFAAHDGWWLVASGGSPFLVRACDDKHGDPACTIDDGPAMPRGDARARLTPGRWWRLDRDGRLLAPTPAAATGEALNALDAGVRA